MERVFVKWFDTETDKQQVEGSISWDGKSFRLDPEDSPLLQRLLYAPWGDKEGGDFKPELYGAAILLALCKTYKSAYLMVTKPEQVKDGNGVGESKSVIPLLRNKPALGRVKSLRTKQGD